jgi:AcrR family transcriptional regulator
MEATGLVKASLYHRFAGGKEEMAEAVLDHASQIFARDLLAPLSAPGEPSERLAETVARLRKFYGSGGRPCLLDTLTINGNNQGIRRRARGTMQYWADAFAAFARECGHPTATARQRAEDAIAALEGGLVLARVSGNRQPFLRALESLPERLMA